MSTKNIWPRLVTVPGLRGSEEAHWQSWLERRYEGAVRVEQDDWNVPNLRDWALRVRDTIEAVRGPLVLAAHSYGCLATAHALAGPLQAEVLGALFVAPAYPRKFDFAGRFEPRRLGLPSIVVGSTNDPWMPLEGARELALMLGSGFIHLGSVGHINTASGFGPWPYGQQLVETLMNTGTPLRRGRLAA